MEEAVTIALRGGTLSVFSGGRKVVEGTDSMPPLPGGSVRFGVYAPGTVALTAFTVYAAQ